MKYDRIWYDNLIKPSFQPPAWVFAPAWAILYMMMTAAFVFIAVAPYRPATPFAYLIFAIQLILNFLWTPTFFGQKKIKKAFFICATLTLCVAVCIYIFALVSLPAALLMIPYLLWLIFASILNYSIWKLN